MRRPAFRAAVSALASARGSRSFPRLLLVVYAPFAAGYFFSYLFRTVNAVVAPDLRQEIGLEAEQLGLLTASYFLSFALFQVPLGLLLDRFGPRRVQGSLYCVAALGTVAFALAESFWTLMLGRALLGLGVAGGLMATLKAIVQWFPPRRVPLLNGWILAAGGIGAISATAPVEFALQWLDWRTLFFCLAAGTFLAAMGILLVVPEKPPAGPTGGLRLQIRELGAIYRDRYFWCVVPLMFTCSSANMAFQGLWAGPWLSEVSGFDRAAVASHLLLYAAATTCGAFLSGVFAAALQRIRVSLTAAVGIGATLHILAQCLIAAQVPLPGYVSWAFLGLAASTVSLSFAAMATHFPEDRLGRANTAANVLVFGASFSYQYGMGLVIALWAPDAAGHYPPVAYVTALTCTIGTQLVALSWYLFSWRRVVRANK